MCKAKQVKKRANHHHHHHSNISPKLAPIFLPPFISLSSFQRTKRKKARWSLDCLPAAAAEAAAALLMTSPFNLDKSAAAAS